MKAAVVVFPGSNCDRDCAVAIERSTGAKVEMVWHQETTLPSGLDLIVLPGALLRNAALKYVCTPIDLEVTNGQTRFTAGYAGRREATLTIGNGEGNFFADEATLDRLEGEGQVVFRYRQNPNGSARAIAGIINDAGNVLGIMPHPDRAFEADLGSADGAILFQSVAGAA